MRGLYVCGGKGVWATIFLDILNVMGSYGVISISFDGHLKIPFKL